MVDLAIFFFLIFVMDWGFIPALLVSMLAGAITLKALNR